MRISEMLTAIANWLENSNNEAMLLAEYDEECLKVVAESCLEAAEVLKLGAEQVEMIEPTPESNLNSQSIDTLAEIAAAFDDSGDEELKKSASAIDELLMTIASPPGLHGQIKAAQDRKLEEVKNKYEDVRHATHELVNASENRKAIENSPYSKKYIMMEHALSTRTCPDHPGAQMARVGENAWQCDLDKKVYDYQAGYTDQKGNKVPGGDVANQNKVFDVDPQSAFDTRESRLNQF